MRLSSMLRRLAIAGCAALMLVDPAQAQQDLAVPGISRELAAWRAARYRDVSYTLDVSLQPPFETLQGRLRLQFQTDVVDGDLILDWRPEHGAGLHGIVVNRTSLDPVRVEREHLLVPRAALRPGMNIVYLEFNAPIRASGTALTRFHDPQD